MLLFIHGTVNFPALHGQGTGQAFYRTDGVPESLLYDFREEHGGPDRTGLRVCGSFSGGCFQVNLVADWLALLFGEPAA